MSCRPMRHVLVQTFTTHTRAIVISSLLDPRFLDALGCSAS